MTPVASAGPRCGRASSWARSSRRRSTRCTRSSASSRSPAATASRATGTCSTRTARSSPTTPSSGELLNEYCVGFPDRSEPSPSQRLPDADDVLAKWMSLRARGARVDLGGQHARARAPARPRPGGARPDPAARVAGAARRRGGMTLPRPRSSAVFDGPDRAAARAYMKGIGFDDEALRRPTVGIANTWIEAMPCNFHLRELAERGQGGRARGGRDADGVQHDRDLRRDHDGHRGDEDLAGQPRGDRRLDRAHRARLPVRRRGRPLGLRQDDPRLA